MGRDARGSRPLAFSGAGEVTALDRRWYLDVNRFARSTSWAHGFMSGYFERAPVPVGAGALVLAAVVLAGWWSARRDPGRAPAVVWSGVGALVALGISAALDRLLARPHPYQVLKGIEVLVPRTSGYALPSGHAALAGAVVCGLVLARRWRLAVLALVAGLLLAFSGVYVGADYPSDVGAGAGLGLVVGLLLWPLASWVLAPAVWTVIDGRFGILLASRRPKRPLAQSSRPRLAAARLPNARAMNALRVASEAARHAPPGDPAPAPPPTSAVRTTPRAPGPEPNGPAAGTGQDRPQDARPR